MILNYSILEDILQVMCPGCRLPLKIVFLYNLSGHPYIKLI